MPALTMETIVDKAVNCFAMLLTEFKRNSGISFKVCLYLGCSNLHSLRHLDNMNTNILVVD